MKQLMKVLGIAGIILCISGLGIFAIGYAYGGSDYIETTEYEYFKQALHLTGDTIQNETIKTKGSSGSDNTKSVRQGATDAKTYKLENKKLNAFTSITADLDYIDLMIKPSKNQSAYISYELHCANNKNPFTYSIKNGCLHLKESGFKASWKTTKYNYGWNMFVSIPNVVTLYVPSKTSYEKSNIIMNDGDLSINGLSCKKAEIMVNYGDVTVKKVLCNTAAVTTKDGDITLTNLNISGKTDIKTTDGDVELADLNISGKTNVKTADGDIILTRTKVAGTLQLNTADGDIDAGLKVSGTLKMRTTDGDIETPSLDISGTAQINTNYGDINASALNISENGSLQLKSLEGDITLQINKKCLNRLAITMDVSNGDLSAGKSLHGNKKRRGDGWHYTKKTTKGNARLKGLTNDGDISIA